jgi:nitroreductase
VWADTPPEGFEPYAPDRLDPDEMRRRASATFAEFDARRSVRHFSPDPVPRELVETAIRSASTAPSGAHRQPWRFVAVGDPELKARLRVAAEEEERRSYEERMPEDWRRAIEPMGTTWEKPFLEIAPWIVVVFELPWVPDPSSPNGRQKNYYVRESVGIACGMFIAALHNMGLATLTHTPSPMGFLGEVLGRPKHERPFLLFPVGYPAQEAIVPVLERKKLEDVAVFL